MHAYTHGLCILVIAFLSDLFYSLFIHLNEIQSVILGKIEMERRPPNELDEMANLISSALNCYFKIHLLQKIYSM